MPILAAGASFIENPENWVLIAFLLFCGLLIYMGVPGVMSRALDERASRIKKELDEAKEIRDDAQKLLAQYQAKARDAEKQAKEILEQARRDAANMAKNARAELDETLARRTRLAEEKIQRAETQAVSDVKAASIDAAVRATEGIVKTRTGKGTGQSLVEEGIRTLGDRLN